MYLGILDLLALGVARMWRESRRGLDWIRRRVDPGGEALMSLGILGQSVGKPRGYRGEWSP